MVCNLPGVVELAQEVFGVPVKLYVPNQIGIRNPAFAHVISLSEYAGNLSDGCLAQAAAVHGDELCVINRLNFLVRLNKVSHSIVAALYSSRNKQL